jgi:hypothetical protein
MWFASCELPCANLPNGHLDSLQALFQAGIVKRGRSETGRQAAWDDSGPLAAFTGRLIRFVDLPAIEGATGK